MSRNRAFVEGNTYQSDIEPVTAQVAANYHNDNGGSSFYVHGGERATSGYAVGGVQGAPESFGGDPMSAADYQAHRDSVRAQVPNKPDVIAGTWNEGGRSVMDASEAIQDRETAKREQIARGERAVYNLGAGREEDLSRE